VGIGTEFKAFVSRGNVMDMAVGVIIGAAFGKIVASFVEDVLMPPLGLAMGGVSFTDLAIVLKPGTDKIAPVLWKYGKFIQTVIDFVIVAFAVFLAVRGFNKMKKEEPPAPPAGPTKDQELLSEIRDLLKSK
jgi:large conductance mechanosensitive channel